MSEEFPGYEEYTPTRLEWMAVQLNNIVPTRIRNTGLEPLFFTGEDGKTLVMWVKSESNLDQESCDDLINDIKSLVTSIAKSYEWDSWLEFEVHFIDEEIDE